MDALSSLPNRSAPLQGLDTAPVSGPTSLESRLQEISLKIIGPVSQIEGPGGEIRIHLDHPLIGPEDIPLNEFVQQLDSLAKTPMPVFTLSEAVRNLSEGSGALASAILSSRERGAPENPQALSQLAGTLAQQAELVEVSIRDIIENSTYPNFSDFLKELVKVAQELRELATNAKMAAIEGQYTVMYAAAEQMEVAAEKAKESRDADIEASKKEAIGQIVGGIASAIISGGFAAAGAGQLGATLGSAAQQIITGSFTTAVSGDKLDASAVQLESDLANVAKQRLEAAVKLIESQTQIAQDLNEIALGLRDMVLKLMQDFISSQNSVIQRANV
jgi:hypothetical protein